MKGRLGLVEIGLKRKYLKEKEVILKILEKGTFLESHVNMLRNQAMSGNFLFHRSCLLRRVSVRLTYLLPKCAVSFYCNRLYDKTPTRFIIAI